MKILARAPTLAERQILVKPHVKKRDERIRDEKDHRKKTSK